jgi:hypothetical protein
LWIWIDFSGFIPDYETRTSICLMDDFYGFILDYKSRKKVPSGIMDYSLTLLQIAQDRLRG